MDQNGAISCYDDPEECLDTAHDLIKRNSDLRSKVMHSTGIKNMKFKFLFDQCSYLYPAGESNRGLTLYLGYCASIPNCNE